MVFPGKALVCLQSRDIVNLVSEINAAFGTPLQTFGFPCLTFHSRVFYTITINEYPPVGIKGEQLRNRIPLNAEAHRVFLQATKLIIRRNRMDPDRSRHRPTDVTDGGSSVQRELHG
jgi:hypothetical protein